MGVITCKLRLKKEEIFNLGGLEWVFYCKNYIAMGALQISNYLRKRMKGSAKLKTLHEDWGCGRC
jgi:hypothetical protein